MKKLILTDCDGVLLDWDTRFTEWMCEKGFSPIIDNYQAEYHIDKRYGITKAEKVALISDFNESDEMYSLSAFRDSIEGVRSLAAQGYKFHVISAMSDSPDAKMKRVENLERIFGADVFHDYTFIGVGADKDEILESYAHSGLLWVEDSIKNYELGHKLGLTSLLMSHDHNGHHETEHRVYNWEDLVSRYM